MIGNDVYVLCASTNPTGLEMIRLYTSGTCTKNPLAVPLIFSLSNYGETYQFKLTTSNNYISYATSGTDVGVLRLDVTPQVIYMNQSAFQPFERPSNLISGVKYTPYGDITIVGALRVYQGTSTDAFELIPVPVNYYTDCENVTTDIYSSLKMMQCSYTDANTQLLCTCSTLAPSWTDQVDCTNANVYQYCSANTFCTSNCKSQCGDPMEVCTYKGDASYTCEALSFPETVVTTPSDQSSMLVAVVIAIVILVVLGMLLALYYWSGPDTSVESYTTRTLVSEPPSSGAASYGQYGY